MQARWIVSKANVEKSNDIAKATGVHPIVAQLMVNRGIVSPREAITYLSPKFDQLVAPQLMPNIDKAAERIKRAILDKERIVIWGDYDVDGVTATATLYHTLKHFNANVTCYIPDRIGEGYGLNDAAVEQLCTTTQANLIITVDCGITAVSPALVAKKHGVDLIVTDHHEWQEEFPDCYTIVHPRLPGATPAYPNPQICGAGVAFKLAWAIGQQMSGETRVNVHFKGLMVSLLAFTALGTIADVVPLQGENRAIAHFGLKELPSSRFCGLQALLDSACLGSKQIDGYHVGFCLAPRLNAAGRMGHALQALDMLIRDNYDESMIIAADLEKKNKDRQATERAIAQEAGEQAALRPDDAVTVVTGKDWHSGVVGIVASRMVERFYRPALVLVDDGEHCHGSGRSIEGFNLAEALGACKGLLTKYGGHAMAAGLKLRSADLPRFRDMFNAYARAHIPSELLVPRLLLDADVPLRDIDQSLVEGINLMGPFGQGNRRPLLLISKAVIRDPKTMGKEGKHLKFTLHQGDESIKCVAFGQGETANEIPTDMLVDVAVEPTLNEYQGNTTVELLVRDILPR